MLIWHKLFLKNSFFWQLVLISILGLGLRIIDYDRIPGWRESDDEIHYAWSGLTWLTNGTPKSWSWLNAYPKSEIFSAWGVNWRLVSPMLEKPPLYPLLSGALVYLSGQVQLEQVRLTTIRLLPLVLSLFTIFLTGILAARIFGKTTGLTAALLYAVIPTLVLSNRLSVTENLLTPLILVTQILVLKMSESNFKKLWLIIVSGLVSGLTFLTKQIGLISILSVSALLIYQKRWRALLIFLAIALSLSLIYPLLGYIYGWNLFMQVSGELRHVGLQGGLPQLVFTIISRPLITTEHLFPDGSILLGWLLFLASPWLMWHKKPENKFPGLVFFSFPLCYLVYLSLIITGAEPIGSGQGFWGWYVYPIFPYLIILLAHFLVDLWQNFSLIKALIMTLILGSSTVRFILLFFPRNVYYRWQLLFFSFISTIFLTKFLPKYLRKLVLLVLFIIYLGVNLYTSLHLTQIYPSLPQP